VFGTSGTPHIRGFDQQTVTDAGEQLRIPLPEIVRKNLKWLKSCYRIGQSLDEGRREAISSPISDTHCALIEETWKDHHPGKRKPQDHGLIKMISDRSKPSGDE
jgi:hypothetical protein